MKNLNCLFNLLIATALSLSIIQNADGQENNKPGSSVISKETFLKLGGKLTDIQPVYKHGKYDEFEKMILIYRTEYNSLQKLKNKTQEQNLRLETIQLVYYELLKLHKVLKGELVLRNNGSGEVIIPYSKLTNLITEGLKEYGLVLAGISWAYIQDGTFYRPEAIDDHNLSLYNSKRELVNNGYWKGAYIDKSGNIFIPGIKTLLDMPQVLQKESNSIFSKLSGKWFLTKDDHHYVVFSKDSLRNKDRPSIMFLPTGTLDFSMTAVPDSLIDYKEVTTLTPETYELIFKDEMYYITSSWLTYYLKCDIIKIESINPQQMTLYKMNFNVLSE